MTKGLGISFCVLWGFKTWAKVTPSNNNFIDIEYGSVYKCQSLLFYEDKRKQKYGEKILFLST